MATTNELRELGMDDLLRRAAELREDLFKDQLKLKTGTLENTASRGAKRRDLARVFTVLSQKQREVK